MALLASVQSIQLLNCTSGQAITISALQDFARKNQNLICLLREPWIDRNSHPATLPDFDTFYPTPLKPKCVTYVCRTPGITATTTFTAQDSFLGTTITSTQNSNTTTFTSFNFYSPGRPEPIARLLSTIPVPKECILMGDLNAHIHGGKVHFLQQHEHQRQASVLQNSLNPTTFNYITNLDCLPTTLEIEPHHQL